MHRRHSRLSSCCMGSETHPLHILLFPFMAAGHTLPVVDMAKIFSAQGVRCTILATPANAPPIEADVTKANHFFLHPIRLHLIPFPSAAVGLPEGCENLSCHSVTLHDQTNQSFLTGVIMLEEPFRRVLAELLPDAIVTDSLLPWTLPIAEELGIPRLAFHGMSFFALCLMESLRKIKMLSDSETAVVIPDLPRHVVMLSSQLPDIQKFGTVFMQNFEQIAKHEDRSYGVVVNSFYELEPEFSDHYRSVLGKKAWHVGPVSLCNQGVEQLSSRGGDKAAIDHHECLKWLDEKITGSVLYVSFGSLCRFTKAQFYQLALGLEACGHPFIWVIRELGDDKWWPEGYMERIEGKAMIIKWWAPQILILNHEMVGGFLTHCGWNSSLEAVSAGVPMVTWPLFSDQFFNERLIVDVLGVGVPVGVHKHSLKEEERPVVEAASIERAIRQMMGSGEEAETMRTRARKLAGMAKKAIEVGGSSHSDTSCLIEHLLSRRSPVVE